MNQRSARELARRDPVLRRVIERSESIVRLKPQRLPPYEALVKAVIYQQLNGKAAETILGRFRSLFPGRGFPTPKAVLAADFERLRSAGLSRSKATYLQHIARHAQEGLVPTLEACEELSDAELIERLTRIKGVGRWTVEMLLIFNLGRPDVLPVHDFGVRRGFQVAYGRRELPSPTALERHGRRWAPYRTTAAWYLWRVLDKATEKVGD